MFVVALFAIIRTGHKLSISHLQNGPTTVWYNHTFCWRGCNLVNYIEKLFVRIYQCRKHNPAVAFPASTCNRFAQRLQEYVHSSTYSEYPGNEDFDSISDVSLQTAFNSNTSLCLLPGQGDKKTQGPLPWCGWKV